MKIVWVSVGVSWWVMGWEGGYGREVWRCMRRVESGVVPSERMASYYGIEMKWGKQ